MKSVLGWVVPVGHEWLTRQAALEVIDAELPSPDPTHPRLDCSLRPDPKDPRARPSWGPGRRAKDLALDSPEAQGALRRIRGHPAPDDDPYCARYHLVLDAIMGQRWVDLGGFRALGGRSRRCWDAVAQQAEEVQYDHFMRKWSDRDGEGGVRAAQASRDRFEEYFLAAAMAPAASVTVRNGGAARDRYFVRSLNYFLFGRALHLFQDSFSSEHTVRREDDDYQTVRQVKAYLCSRGAEQHVHGKAPVLLNTSGDVIWRSRLLPGRPRNAKVLALVAVEASKDLWAAFIRTMGAPRERREAAARSEARRLADSWLGFDEQAMRSYYADHGPDGSYVGGNEELPRCMKSLDPPLVGLAQQEAVALVEAIRSSCLYDIQPESGWADLYDASMMMPFHWKWRPAPSRRPPEDWRPPARGDYLETPPLGEVVRIRSAASDRFEELPDGSWRIQERAPAGYLGATGQPHAPLLLAASTRESGRMFVRTPGHHLRAIEPPYHGRFLGWRDDRLTLQRETEGAAFLLLPVPRIVGEVYAIRSLDGDQLWLDGALPRLGAAGGATDRRSWWEIERVSPWPW